MAAWIDIGGIDILASDGVVCVVANDIEIALFRQGDDYFALNDICTHGFARFSEGFVEDGCVECPLHQGLVDIRTGAPMSAPIIIPIQSYPVRRVGERLEVEI